MSIQYWNKIPNNKKYRHNSIVILKYNLIIIMSMERTAHAQYAIYQLK